MAPGSRLQELTAKYMQNPRRFFVPLANEYHLSGDLDRAIALCREHLPAQPGHMSGHIVLGRAYYTKGDLQAAHDVFLTSVALDDENLIALRHLGDIARSRQETVEAGRWYARVLEADPDNAEVEQIMRSLDAPIAAESALSAPTASGSGLAEGDLVEVAGSEYAQDGEQRPEIVFTTSSDLSGLADPTPPGLRAIVGSNATPTFDAELVRQAEPVSPAVLRPLETFDLSTLGETVEDDVAFDATGFEDPAEALPADMVPSDAFDSAGIAGAGFTFSDLDQIVEPVVAPALDSLSSVADAADSSAVPTPSATSAIVADAAVDELLSRPVFGALASFASWRTAQERLTPAASTALPEAALPTPELAVASDFGDLFLDDLPTDAAPTAPEFVTETMAALYAQQGFTQQAIDIYRVLLARNSDDAALMTKVLALQALLDRAPTRDFLQDDADTALQFGVMDETGSADAEVESVIAKMHGAAPASDCADTLGDAFDTAWSLDADSALIGGDDWFDDAANPEPIAETLFGGDEILGLAMAGFAPTADVAAGESVAESVSDRPAVALIDVFGSSPVAAADDAASHLLIALAEQMVGRLPKEPPTLPVPDVLEMPSPVVADATLGASPAPLLSFDRFFSGSGSPPRPRVDTPMRPGITPPPDVPDATASVLPSLSPTFGGVPVIPPVTPSASPTWAAFDPLVAPADRPSTMPAPAPRGGAAVFWTPIGLSAIPEAPVARPAPPQDATPVTPPAAVQPSDESAQPEPPRTPPSDFHRWLEGLS